MTQDTSPPFSREDLEGMNQKAVQNQFFTPDNVYIDFSLFKDLTVGAMFADAFGKGQEHFTHLQKQFMAVIEEYQVRTYDTSDAFLAPLGYPDQVIEELLATSSLHDQIFLQAPATNFFSYLIRQTVRNQNHSNPAGKHIKKKIDKDQYILESIPVTYHINTYPLHLSPKILASIAQELGESLGVNIKFLDKDPQQFDQTDWTSWMEKIDCFYLNSLGRFTSGDLVFEKQGAMVFTGIYLFARKRFEKHVMAQMRAHDFSQQIAMLTAQLDMMCDFAWIPNGDVLLLPDPVSLRSQTPEQME